ncbi:homoserine O-succinyltransferase MetX [Thioflexithrix psekupsensis]|uniref:Homoserine O-succinyltransferase n=1 Tax=Thioflexithrix psekupsensis TaxID=1570016 RepID=A0A251X8P0_9GAMM|nr:homoserine O-acetyltransferase [Thioflexithrix psekupsensis]OUD14043.1 homoserine O-acetyltransferase [Thioflexithrix psekupsensis]
MPEIIPSDNVGIVTPQRHHFTTALALDCGRVLPQYELVYETYGTLNKARSNAILICHALSGDHHAAGYHHAEDRKAGWWDNCIGPNKPIDTQRFFVVSLNNLGGCRGSTGPISLNPETQRPYGPDFPIITVRDWVHSQAQLGALLGIEQWAAVIGGSLGGMQALQWAMTYPDKLRHCIAIASAPKLSTQNIAFNEVARQAIMTDPNFHEGRYYDYQVIPKQGLMLARMLGHITYLSEDAMRAKFGRELREGKLNFSFDVDFQIESYLRYQGRSFVDRFDANTYLLMTKALDYFDPASEYDHNLSAALAIAQAKFLVISFTSDWRFSSERSKEIVKALLDARKKVTYLDIKADDGHDAFLMPIPLYFSALKAYLKTVADESDEITH